MITPEQIVEKARRLYSAFLRAWLRGEPFFPQTLPIGGLPADYKELHTAVGRLLKGAKGSHGAGYTLELQTRQTQRFGTQSLPARVIIPSERDLLALIGKEAEFTAFQADVAYARRALPQLEQWMAQQPHVIIEHHSVWPELLQVCAYLLAHPRPQVYPRELPIPVHTKFIEEHIGILRRLLDALLPPEAVDRTENAFERRFGLRYDEPLIRMRFLDDLPAQRYGLPLSDISVPLSQFAALPLHGQCCLIVENKMTFLTLPSLAHTVAIFGKGFHVELLAKVGWLAAGPLFYWGDLDAQGFQILSQLRAAFPHAVAVMMDSATFEAFRGFAVTGTPCAARELPHLTPDEHALFVRLACAQLRLEQERISYAYAAERLQGLGGNAIVRL